ncbi:MAG: DUF507 family protein [Bdellovibrionales bacterium]
MKLTDRQIKRLTHLVLRELEAGKVITYKAPTHEVLERGVQIIKGDYTREANLDQEVQRMMDDLERQNPGTFERYKMFPLLKKRLAKEKGIIL